VSPELRGWGRPGGGEGFSLLEVIVALLILQVSLVGVLGLFALASRKLGRALMVERAAAEAQAVADSLSRLEAPGSGESVRGGWLVSWSGEGGALRVQASRVGQESLGTLVELELP
jgi:Tfp pilus assembly protein PilV